MKENCQAKGDRYIMYPRFIMMMINDKFKDLPKNRSDIVDVRNITTETIARVTKEDDERMKQMIFKIKNPAYVTPENDKWRHEKSDSDSEEAKMSEMVEKRTRWWCVRDGKRKRTPKTSPTVSIPKDVEKGSSGEPQQRLIDETVLEKSVAIEQGASLLKQTLESYLNRNQDLAAQKVQGSSAQAEDVTTSEPEDEDQDISSEDYSEATQSESELDPTTLRRGKAQLKKKPLKKKKVSDKEDSSYEPEEPKKQLKKRKAVQARVIPRNVRARKYGAEPSKEKGGKKEKHLQKSKVLVAKKAQSVETPKEPMIQSVEVPVVEAQKRTGGDDDYVEITGFKATNPSRPPSQDKPESSQPKETSLDFMFEGLPGASGFFTEDIPEDDFDMFKHEVVNELQVEELKKVVEEIKTVMINQAEKLKKLKDGVHDNSQLFELLAAKNVEMSMKMKKLEEINEILKGMIGDLHEASSNEMKVIKLEMEAMKADKVIVELKEKDNWLKKQHKRRQVL
ncbi:hypothetical protein Hanom_Chr05g00414181 [Helianthus anomalus]